MFSLLAEQIDCLISSGHQLKDVWQYTPKQSTAFVLLLAKRKKKDFADLLALHANAAQAQPKQIKELLRDLQK